MKFTILAFGAAAASILCINYSHAQFQVGSPLPQQTIRLVSQDENDAFGLFSQPDTKESSSDNSSILNQAQPIAELSESSEQIPDAVTPAPTNQDSPIPVTARPGKFAEKAPLAALAHTPEVGMVPVYWPQGMAGCATPNPIAAMMTRNWCTQGLWDSYQCERDLQCQCIQQQLNSSGNCGHGHCGHGHCGHGHCNHSNHGFAVNRYSSPGSAAACYGPGSAGAGCDAGAPSQVQWAPSTAVQYGQFQPGQAQPGQVQPGQMIHAPSAPAGNNGFTPSAPAPAPATSPAPTPLVNGSPVYRSLLMPNDLPTVPAGATSRPIARPVVQMPSPTPSVASRPLVAPR